jgi:hypothetical protein
MTKQHIFNLDFVAADNFDEIIDAIINKPTTDSSFPVVITPNVDLTVHLNKNKELLPDISACTIYFTGWCADYLVF